MAGWSGSGMQASLKNNLRLRRGRNTLFERKGPKINFQPGPEAANTSAHVREKFRNQLTRERFTDRRNSLYGFAAGLIICLIVWIYQEPIIQFLAWLIQKV
jgi:hypothetical protein